MLVELQGFAEQPQEVSSQCLCHFTATALRLWRNGSAIAPLTHHDCGATATHKKVPIHYERHYIKHNVFLY